MEVVLLGLSSEWTGRKWSKAIEVLVEAFLFFQAVESVVDAAIMIMIMTVHWTTAILLGTRCQKWEIPPISLLILLTVAKVAGHLTWCQHVNKHLPTFHHLLLSRTVTK